MLDPVGRHQVVQEQVPVAAVHEEPDGLEVLVEEAGQLGERLGLAAAVMDGGGPGAIRSDGPFELGEEGGIAGEVRGVGRAEEVAEEEPGCRPRRVAERHSAGDR